MPKGVAAFTLLEAMISLGVLVFFTIACMTSIVVNQVAVRKAKEEALVMDFMTEYTENLKALPFANLNAGQPINALYTGISPSVYTITIPANGTWVPLNTAAYGDFYPDLTLWLGNRNPQMLVTLTKNSVSGTVHDIEVDVQVVWDPPVGKGGQQQVQVDFLRTKDATQL